MFNDVLPRGVIMNHHVKWPNVLQLHNQTHPAQGIGDWGVDLLSSVLEGGISSPRRTITIVFLGIIIIDVVAITINLRL